MQHSKKDKENRERKREREREMSENFFYGKFKV
jgi:hypothetical protein